MTKSYEQLNRLAQHHLKQAEHWQQVAESLEKIASDRSHNDQMAAHLLKTDEDLAFPYRQATGNRNAHQQQAILYSLMALLEQGTTPRTFMRGNDIIDRLAADPLVNEDP